MTIAQTRNAIKGIIHEHSVYGCEVIINSIVAACKDHPYLKLEDLHKMLDTAYRHEVEYEERKLYYERR